ncbi:hypothetical protein H634G_04037 [Metarhizium anisopliae BRIP 53293]|uniref:Aminotransferase class I/classII large domain-containing protein n=1 Tax=Metarhizium anisopliae BRIP 53293 TaxID=1291518 RepID=A0A0D9P144_METAN|nr:hypothetical protein H634G_04037 [Metarhizium anisopliae BRIP 53293]
MLSNRGSHHVQRIIPSLIANHLDQPRPNDIAPIDLSTAENRLMEDWTVKSVASSASELRPEELYLQNEIGGSLTCRKVLAAFFNANLDPLEEVQASQIVIAPGASVVLDSLIRNICNPGEAVLIATPYWSGLDMSVSVQNEARVLRVHVPLHQAFDTPAVIERYGLALASSQSPVRAIIVTNPHNPLGRCFPRDLLEALIQFCVHHDLHFISDEVYATSIYYSREDWERHGQGPYQPFLSALSLVSPDSPAAKLLHVVYSVSKDFGISGLRMGALITQANQDMRMACALVVHAQVSCLTCASITSLLSRRLSDDFILENRRRLGRARREIQKWLCARDIQHVPAYAGLFIFARLCSSGSTEDEKALEKEISTRGVRVVRGTNYFCQEPGWFRLVFSHDTTTLRESLERIDGALRKMKGESHVEM